MRSPFLQAVSVALVCSRTVAQSIDLDLVAAASDPPTISQAVGVTSQIVSYDTAALKAQATHVSSVTVAVDDVAPTSPAKSSRFFRRGDCAKQPPGAKWAPWYFPDNAAAFRKAKSFGNVASKAAVPRGYKQVFANLKAANNAYGYLGFTTLQRYDTEACACQCNKIRGCVAINIYYERDPSRSPGSGCPNPRSLTRIKCVFFGGPINTGNAVNTGQWQEKFEVAITGSNGYMNHTVATPAGYVGPEYLGNAAINAPYDSQGYNTYMGSTVFTAGPFDASLCATYCTSQTQYNIAHPPSDGSPVQTCQFFNTYILYVNQTSQSQGQYCAIYSTYWDTSYGTNTGQYRGSDHYLIDYSYTFTNSSNPGSNNKQGAIYQARGEITASSLQPFCSSFLGYTAATATETSSPSSTPTDAIAERDDGPSSTPDILTKYPATVVSSACSLAVTTTTTSVDPTIS